MSSESIQSRRLIDRIVSNPKLGRLRGFVGTTYEMQPEFVEPDFLPSLLGLGAWDDRSWTSRIAMEKVLHGMDAAVVFMEGTRYHGRHQSLRIELVPVSGPSKLHSKVLFLLYESGIRLLTGSSNLTIPGYRLNREVMTFIEATKERSAGVPLITAALDGASEILAPYWNDSARAIAVAIKEMIASWQSRGELKGDSFAWSGPGKPLVDQVLPRWPHDEEVTDITLVSPFWSVEGKAGPITTFLSRMRSQGILADGAKLRLLTQARQVRQNEYAPELRSSMEGFAPGKLGVRAFVQPVDPTASLEEVDSKDFLLKRDLHAKVAILSGRKTTLAYVGSANFTNRGWGLFNAAPNIEAGLIICREGRQRSELQSLIPAAWGEEIELLGSALSSIEVVAPTKDDHPWPSFIRSIWLEPKKSDATTLVLRMSTEPKAVEGVWTAHLNEEDDQVSGTELIRGGPQSNSIQSSQLSKKVLEQLLRQREVRVKWWSCPDGVSYPINVSLEARESLPLAPGAADPGEQQLLAYYQGKIAFEEMFNDPQADEKVKTPNPAGNDSAVDTSNIQSYQIREFVEALAGIEWDLKAAAESPATMRLAVTGPVSPRALARTIKDAIEFSPPRRSPTAGAFQLMELIGCLTKARSYAPKEPVLEKRWSLLIEETIKEIMGMLNNLRDAHPDQLGEKTDFACYHRTMSGYLAEENRS